MKVAERYPSMVTTAPDCNRPRPISKAEFGTPGLELKASSKFADKPFVGMVKR
jgi:hypothetical protein